jgi:hypothetical protein
MISKSIAKILFQVPKNIQSLKKQSQNIQCPNSHKSKKEESKISLQNKWVANAYLQLTTTSLFYMHYFNILRAKLILRREGLKN